jgi:hypothetical protein
MINDPVNSYGFMIRLEDETYYRALVFASSNEPDPTKNPKLEICYSIPDGVKENALAAFIVYPNPVHHKAFIQVKEKSPDGYNVSVVNIPGEEIYRKHFNSEKMEISTEQFSQGIYFLKIESEKGVYTQKLIVNM